MTNDLRDRLQSSLGNTYTLDRELGGGGMSRVFTATETALGRAVVVKVLPPELAAGVSTERFKREIAVAARLQHPHIVPLLSAGEIEGLPYFTMPFVEGESLRTRLARRGELPVSESVRILREIASALAYAHEHGVVHRDIKPDNVLFSGDVAMVADFGVAKALSASSNGDHGGVTSLGVALGTPAYMAPEQATADPATDHRADVYAFGVLAYEVLTGQPPFVGRNPSQLLAAHVTEVPETIARRRPNLPPALAALVMRCLEKRPSDRPQTAGEIVHALDDITTPSGGTVPTNATLRPTTAATELSSTSGALAPARKIRSGLVVVGIAGLVLVAAGLAVWRRSAASSSQAATAAQAAADATRSRRIAVLPFENLGDSADAYFADGITDAIRGKLTGVSTMEVIARASSAQYHTATQSPAEIARELGVRYLLTGTVRWAKGAGGASHVQVSPELVEIGADGSAASRWQQPFDAPLADVFRVQGEIAGKVASAMQVALGGSDQARLVEVPTRNAAAYDAYLRAEAMSATGDAAPSAVRRRVEAYEQVIRLDSTFSDAWARVGSGLSTLYANGVPDPRIAARARAAAERALRLSPNSAIAHRAMATYFIVVELDPLRALVELNAALAVAPNDVGVLVSLAATYLGLGRLEDAVERARVATQLDPRSSRPLGQLGDALTVLHRYGEARPVTERAFLVAPNPTNAAAMARVALGDGNLAEARRIIREAGERVGQDDVLAHLALYGDLGWAADDAGRQRLLEFGPEVFDGDRAGWALVRAQVQSWRGDTTLSRAWGDSAAREFAVQLRAAPGDAQLHALRGMALAYAGRHNEAVAAVERGITLAPADRSYRLHVYAQHLLARVYILSGDHAKALDVIEGLVARPSTLSVGMLRIDPNFGPLRGNPRFERLIAR